VRDKGPYKEGDEVMLLVEEFTDLGIKVIVDGKYEGLLYKNDVYQKLSIGEQLEGYIKKIRQDNKIDVTLRKGGLDDIKDARDAIMEKLREHEGFLPLSDNSTPEIVKEMLQMSKKLFKKAIGGLYKDEIIEIKQNGIRLKTKTHPKIAKTEH
jgi:predicted RNA-binding protein (virulence factor B family)